MADDEIRRCRVCRSTDFGVRTTRGFEININDKRLSVIVIRSASARFVAYLNRCPHLGVPLDWEPDAFLDLTGTYLQCATHGALFEIADGRCIWGPCLGRSLIRISVCEAAGWIELVLPDYLW